MHKMIGFFMAIALATFALPSFADSMTKHFRLDTQVDGSDSTLVKITLTNDNPSGSSAQISSFIVSVSSVTGLTIPNAPVPDAASFAAFGGTVNLISSTSFSVNGLSPNLKAGDAYVLTLHVAGCGDGNQWSAAAYTGSAFTGGTVLDDHLGVENTDIACGSASCNPTQVFSYTQTYGSVTLSSGKYTQDGDTCLASDYFITDTIAQNTILKFRAIDSSLAFVYSIFDTQSVAIPWTTNSKVAWACDPTSNSLCWVKAQSCELLGVPTHPGSAYLPWPYAKLVQDNGTKIKVDPSLFSATNPVPPVPFPIFVEHELMMVTKIVVSTNTWSVDRCQWGTCTSVTTHVPNLLVMSTVLPRLPLTLPTGSPYAAGTPAQMCFVPGTNQLIQSFDSWSSP